MKITKVEVIQEKPAKEHPRWRPIFCRIYTDEGIYGDGEAAMAYGVGSYGAFGMLVDFSKLIIGMDPLDHEIIWEKLYKLTFWAQNGGSVAMGAISAIDIALWDIKGKFFNMPIYKLLGGKRRSQLRTYASQLQFGWDCKNEVKTTLEDYCEVAKKAVSEGFDCVKIDFFTFDTDGRKFTSKDQTTLRPPYYVDLVESRVAAVRETIGPKVDIMMENHSFTDASAAIQIGRRVQKYNIFAFEEPTSPSPKVMKHIADSLDMPLAQGERVYGRIQYIPYFEDMSMQLIQPDLGTCGGITEGKKICDMAYSYDVSVQLHVCASPLSTAAALHLESTLPNFCIHEHHTFNLKDWNRKLCTVDWQPESGMFTVPEGPGLGCELSDYALHENVENRIIVEDAAGLDYTK
ncbi:MAG: mandelate racemase/muconate lactonizing enzyme family protein [Clostridiales bacterium]|nr:mandelate racemase/muconate lactonizing enzyme family protein [Clostridiales bacterium]